MLTLHRLPNDTPNNIPMLNLHMYRLPNDTPNHIPILSSHRIPNDTPNNIPMLILHRLPNDTPNNLSMLTLHRLPNDTLNHIPMHVLLTHAVLESAVGRVEGNSLPLVVLENKKYINLADVSASVSNAIDGY